MSNSGYKPLSQEEDADLLGDILSEFDPASYFDDWFDEPSGGGASSQKVVDQLSAEEKTSVRSPQSDKGPINQQTDEVRRPESPVSRQHSALKPPSTDPDSENYSQRNLKYGVENESLDYREYRDPSQLGVYEEDDLSYDHYDLVQAGVEPFERSFSQSQLSDSVSDSGVDVEHHSLLGKRNQYHHSSKNSFDIDLSDEETAKRARWCLVCLKTYCVIFVITVISLSIYVAADQLRDFSTEAKIMEKEELSDTESGYKELRLGGRRVFYRIKEAADMANHTVLLVHGESQSGRFVSG